MLTLESLAASLTLPEIKELERIKMAAIMAESADRAERVRRKQEEVRKLEQEAQKEREEMTGLFAQVKQVEREIAPMIEAAGRKTFTVTPVYPVNKNGNPLPVTSAQVQRFIREAKTVAEERVV